MDDSGVPPGNNEQDSCPDEMLVHQYQTGHESAAGALYSRYEARVRAQARAKISRGLTTRVDVEDIVQSVFRRFFHAASLGRYSLPTGTDLESLLAAITRNRLRSAEGFHRAAKRDLRQTVGEGAMELTAQISREAPADEHAKLVTEEVLVLLPTAHRAVIEHRLHGYEVAEIAVRLGRSKRSVERLLQEARIRLQIVFEVSRDDCQPQGVGP